MRTPRLPVVEWTDTPADLADLNGLVRFAERRNLVSARVPSPFKRSLLTDVTMQTGSPRRHVFEHSLTFKRSTCNYQAPDEKHLTRL